MKPNKEESTAIKSHKMRVLAQASAPNLVGGKNNSTTRQLVSALRNGVDGVKLSDSREYKLSQREDPVEADALENVNKLAIREVYSQTMIILKISSKMETRQVYVPTSLEMSVKEFKEKFFEKEISTEGMGVRLINNGKEMRDSHLLKDHGLAISNTVYVFFFKKEDKPRRETSLSTKGEADFNNITDTEALDFDYFKERQNLTVALD